MNSSPPRAPFLNEIHCTCKHHPFGEYTRVGAADYSPRGNLSQCPYTESARLGAFVLSEKHRCLLRSIIPEQLHTGSRPISLQPCTSVFVWPNQR